MSFLNSSSFAEKKKVTKNRREKAGFCQELRAFPCYLQEDVNAREIHLKLCDLWPAGTRQLPLINVSPARGRHYITSTAPEGELMSWWQQLTWFRNTIRTSGRRACMADQGWRGWGLLLPEFCYAHHLLLAL